MHSFKLSCVVETGLFQDDTDGSVQKDSKNLELILEWIIEPMSENHRPFGVDLSARRR